MYKERKLHVFIVLEYAEEGGCKIMGVYSSRSAARAKVIRLEHFALNPLTTYHIIKKSVQGVLYAFTLTEDKKEFYKIYLDK